VINKKPIEYVELIEDPLLANDLIQLLAEPKSWLCWLLKTPMKKVKKSKQILFQFYILLIINFVFMFLLLFQYVPIILFIIHSFLLILVIMTSMILANKDPGYIEKDDSMDFQKLLETGNLDKVCPICQIAVTAKIRHCQFWNRCIEHYDHHCPWINNWVGAKNHNLFIIFVLLLFLFLIFNISISIIFVKEKLPGGHTNSITIESIGKIFQSEWISRVFLIINIILCFLALLLTGYVMIIQIGNFMTNSTTYERFSHEGMVARKKRKKHLSKLRKHHNVNHKSSIISKVSDSYKDNESTNKVNYSHTMTQNLIDEDSSMCLNVTFS
jgi:palmitoyltransferase ZDHHC13/17